MNLLNMEDKYFLVELMAGKQLTKSEMLERLIKFKENTPVSVSEKYIEKLIDAVNDYTENEFITQVCKGAIVFY